MKIAIDKTAFTWVEADEATERMNELKSSDPFSKSEQERMMTFYTNSAFHGRILEFKATISKNTRPIMQSNDGYNAEIDCWVEMFIESLDDCFKVGFFLGDFWMLDSDNHERVKRHAYIRKYVAE